VHADLAMLDLAMPGIDGFELIRGLKAIPAWRKAEYVALSGYGQSEDREATKAAGFAAHLVKPLNLATLTATLRTLLADR
jgi:CheY-like chemotaxis protein